jgi:hypothetical protein
VILREESEQLGEHISQEKEGKNPKEYFMCVCCSIFSVGSYRTDLYNSYKKEGMIFEATLWHKNQGCFLEYFSCC